MEDSHLADLAKTFAKLRQFRMKLTPDKCLFEVPWGKPLGFIVSQCDIEPKP